MKKKIIITFALIAGALILWAAIYLSAKVEQVRNTVHYHANIAFYINGERLDISDDKFMEDIGACKAGSDMSPLDRVHFHENNMDTIHIHDSGVTWGHLLSNLGFFFSRETIILDDGQIIGNDENKKWTYILNGQQIRNPFNQQILSTDRLLLSYGDQDEDALSEIFETVADNAQEYNGKYDPGTCSTDANQNPIVKAIVEMLDGHSMDHSDH